MALKDDERKSPVRTSASMMEGDSETNSGKMHKTDPYSYQGDDRTLYHLPPLPSCETYHTDKEDYDLESLAKTLETDGVVVVPNVYSQDQIKEFQRAHQENLAEIQELMSETKAHEKPYRHDFDKKRYYVMPHYWIQDEDTKEWFEIIEISPGRLDYTYGMNSLLEESSDTESCNESESERNCRDVFGSKDFQRPRILAELMDKLLKEDYDSYAGALPSAGNSGDGPWHRDVYLLFDDENLDIKFPHPYYFTVLIPLVEVDAQNGATEFLLGSHKQTCAEALKDFRSYQPQIKPGSMLVFDGRICHRGRRNLTAEDRTVLYMTWTKKWYNDY